eukprot:scaffold163785_cov37-Cyclotella_meneghiniana.AAC.2
MEPTPNNNESPSKRRRFDIPPTPADTNIDRYIATSTASPLRQTPSRDPVDDGNVDATESQDDMPLTQDPTLLLHVSANQASTDASSTPAAAPADPLIAAQPQPSIQPITPLNTIADVYGFNDPRPFQIEAIIHVAFEESSLVLIRRTADGKSLVPLTVSILRGGVTLVLVPLHGLGSDQVDKATVPEHGIEAYYIDEHKFDNAKSLQDRLDVNSEEKADQKSGQAIYRS